MKKNAEHLSPRRHCGRRRAVYRRHRAELRAASGLFHALSRRAEQTLGGELNAVLLTALISAALGGAISLALNHLRHIALYGRPAAQYR